MIRHHQRTTAVFSAVALSIGLVACGGDGGGDAGEATAVVVAVLTEMIVEEGMSADEATEMVDAECVADVVAKLSDGDVQRLIDDGTESELSTEGDAAMEGVIECITLPE